MEGKEKRLYSSFICDVQWRETIFLYPIFTPKYLVVISVTFLFPLLFVEWEFSSFTDQFQFFGFFESGWSHGD